MPALCGQNSAAIVRVMNSLHVRTPLWESRPLSAALGSRVYLKLEALQPTGSFKIRGVGRACQLSRAEGARKLVASSGGNAGYAVAYAGRRLGLPVTVVLPETTSPLMQGRVEAEGATVIQHGSAWDDSHSFALALAHKESAAYIHPFDDPRLWEGHATLIEEIREDGVRPDIVVVAVGGGGLLCGVLQGLHQVGWQDVPVCTVETEGAASFARSVEVGELITLERLTSVATSLGARRVSSRALAWTDSHDIHTCKVSDAAAVRGVLRFADDHRLLVEPACGAALSVAYDRAEALAGRKTVLIVLCGGAGVTQELLVKWSLELGLGKH